MEHSLKLCVRGEGGSRGIGGGAARHRQDAACPGPAGSPLDCATCHSALPLNSARRLPLDAAVSPTTRQGHLGSCSCRLLARICLFSLALTAAWAGDGGRVWSCPLCHRRSRGICRRRGRGRREAAAALQGSCGSTSCRDPSQGVLSSVRPCSVPCVGSARVPVPVPLPCVPTSCMAWCRT